MKRLFLFLHIVSISGAIYAQTNKDFQIWNAALVNYNFENNWLFEIELDYNRLVEGGPNWREVGIQPSLEYYPSQSFDVFLGVYTGVVRQFPEENSNEIRPLVGFRWNIVKPEKRVFIRWQNKYEFRNFKNIETGETSESNRVRSRFDVFIPITKKSYNDDQNLYLKLMWEYFGNLDENIKERFRTTQRLITGLGYRFTYSWRLEFDYIRQGSRNNINEDFDSSESDILMFTLKYYVPKPKSLRNPPN